MCPLFDSLLRGYPIGTFLFWRMNEATATQFQFSDVMRNYHEVKLPHSPKVDLPEARPAIAILDGQQRLPERERRPDLRPVPAPARRCPIRVVQRGRGGPPPGRPRPLTRHEVVCAPHATDPTEGVRQRNRDPRRADVGLGPWSGARRGCPEEVAVQRI